MDKINIEKTHRTTKFIGLPILQNDNDSETPCSFIRRRPTALKMKSLSTPLSNQINSAPIPTSWTRMEKIGFGTYSEVRRAVNKKTKQVAAVKICKGSTSCRMLKAEAEILQQIESDYIPKFYDLQLDSISNRAFLAMELVDGDSLDQYVQKNGTLSEEDARSVMSKLISAVNELHRRGIAHRDIKPQNIIITDDKHVKLIDFNISKKTRAGRNKSGETHNKFKCTFFSQVSSPAYAAPEVLSRECYSESVDIWGLGVALAEMLFKVSHELESRDGQRLSEIVGQLESCGDVSDQTLSQMKAMLSEKPNERPSISELIEQFRQ